MVTGTTSLVTVLESLGVTVKSIGEQEIVGCCPVHLRRTGKEDRSPSWSINSISGLWFCHSCGARGNLHGLLTELSGSPDIATNYYTLLINATLEQMSVPQVVYKPAVNWELYERFSDVPEDLLSKRHITSEAARVHGLKWDTLNSSWVIPIISAKRDIVGWQLKSLDGVKNYPVGVKKSNNLFGIERFSGDTAILVESPLDVVRLTSLGTAEQGLSTFGASVSSVQINMLSNVCEKVIVAMDNDTAGIESSKKLFKALPRFRKGVLWLSYQKTKAKDIGEMSDLEILDAISDASAVPGWVT